MQDHNKNNRSNTPLGDSQSLTKGKTNGTAYEDRLGVHELVNGRDTFRMIDGTMTKTEMIDMQNKQSESTPGFTQPNT